MPLWHFTFKRGFRIKILIFSLITIFSFNTFASSNKVLSYCTFDESNSPFTINPDLTSILGKIPGINTVYNTNTPLDLATVSGNQDKPLTIEFFEIEGSSVSFDQKRTIFIGEQIYTDDIEGTLTYNAYYLKNLIERRGLNFIVGTCAFEQ